MKVHFNNLKEKLNYEMKEENDAKLDHLTQFNQFEMFGEHEN